MWRTGRKGIILPRGTWPIYLAWLLTSALPSICRVLLTLQIRQSEKQVTDSQTTGSGLLKDSKEWVRMGWQPALEWLLSGLLRPSRTSHAP